MQTSGYTPNHISCMSSLSDVAVKFCAKKAIALKTARRPNENGACSPWRSSSANRFCIELAAYRHHETSTTIYPLQESLRRVYTCCDKQTKQSISMLSVNKAGWLSIELNAFDACKQALTHHVTLVYWDVTKWFHVYCYV